VRDGDFKASGSRAGLPNHHRGQARSLGVDHDFVQRNHHGIGDLGLGYQHALDIAAEFQQLPAAFHQDHVPAARHIGAGGIGCAQNQRNQNKTGENLHRTNSWTCLSPR
jgi:hypothetical protein